MDRNPNPSPPGDQHPGWSAPPPSRSSGIPVASSSLGPVAKKTLSMDPTSSHLPLPLSQAGARVRLRDSVTPVESGTARGTVLRPAGSPVPRKLSSLSFTLHHPSQRVVAPSPGSSRQQEVDVGSAKGQGEPPTLSPPPASLVPILRARSASPGNPNPVGPTRVPFLEKPLLTSHLALSSQPAPSGMGLPSPYTSQTPSPGSPGKAGTWHLGIPRLQLPSGRGSPAQRLLKSGRITVAKPGGAGTPGSPGATADPGPATPRPTVVSSMASTDAELASSERTGDHPVPDTAMPGMATGSARSGVGPGPAPQLTALLDKDWASFRSAKPKALPLIRDPEERGCAKDLLPAGALGHPPVPVPAPDPASDLALHSPHTPAARGTDAAHPARGPPASAFSAVGLPSSSRGPARAEPRSALPMPEPLPDPGAPCTAMVLAPTCSAGSLVSRDAKVVFTVPGIDTASALPGIATGLPAPTQPHTCTSMVLVTQKGWPYRAKVARLVESRHALAAPVPPQICHGPEPKVGAALAAPQEEAACLDILDLARIPKGLPPLGPNQSIGMEGLAWRSEGWLTEDRTDGTMSELVAEPRPKPAVPVKPVGISSNLLGYIGIDTIIEQMRKKTMKTGFDFNIMVVGQSGLGKSTLINTLFKSQVSRKSASWNREEKIPKTVEIKAIGHVIEEGGVKMKLTVIDTPGFGDQINNENCWEPIQKYINEQYEKFLKEEVNIARKKRIPDTRVHCCLYFISPTGHSLRPLDLEFMKHLSKVVNIVPIIAKADTMTLEEKMEFKQRVRKELEVHGIEFYPQKEFDEDLEDKTENDKIRQESMPFAVVGSDKEYQVNGKRVLGRKTPWGIIEVENLTHCEFALLRDFVIRTHLQDLKEVTHNIHYETYRARRLNDNGGLPPAPHPSNLTSFKGLGK